MIYSDFDSDIPYLDKWEVEENQGEIVVRQDPIFPWRSLDSESFPTLYNGIFKMPDAMKQDIRRFVKRESLKIRLECIGILFGILIAVVFPFVCGHIEFLAFTISLIVISSIIILGTKWI